MMFKSRVISTTLAALIICLMCTSAYPCDIAVVSARVSTTGRPFIWKSLDASGDWHQEIKYYDAVTPQAGAYIMTTDYDVWAQLNTGNQVNPHGGVNEAGFAISVTSVYEDLVPIEEALNVNTDLVRHALQECATLDDFEALLQRFNGDHFGKVISGNFVAIDAKGGAALYEVFSDPILGMLRPVMYRKYDANNGNFTDYCFPFNFTIPGNGDSFVGFVNRTNANSYLPIQYGEERRWRANDLLTNLANTGRLNYRNLMTEVAKDVYGQQIDGYGHVLDQASCQSDYSTTYCISRAATRLAMVIDGVAPGGDPRLSTFWCVLGEPSVGVFLPYFVNAREVSWLAWVDDVDMDGKRYDLSDNSLLARASNRREIYENLIYYSNEGSVLTGMEDKKMNKNELMKVQQWTFPLEDFVFKKTEEFLADLTANPSYRTTANLRDFSNYCAEYVYNNYNDASANSYAWTFAKPWGSAWVGYTRGGF